MPKQKYVWIVERKIGDWVGWVTKGRKGPQPDEHGKMKFGKQEHLIDPNKFRIWKVPRGIRAGDIVKLQVWEQDTIAPMDYLSKEKKVGDEVTGSMLAHVSKIKTLQLSRQNRETEKIVIIMAIALIVAMIAISVLAYLVVSK